MHRSVLLKEAVDALGIEPGGLYIDATYGEGGHAREIEVRGGRVIGIDIDPIQVAKQVEKGVDIIHGSFGSVRELMNRRGITAVQGILFDLGLSMEQIRSGGRGLSYRQDHETLDMRLDPSLDMTASTLLNQYSESQLSNMFMQFAEDIDAPKVARTCVIRRKKKQIVTVYDFKQSIAEALQKQISENDLFFEKKCATYFQALRMEVNDELRTLKEGLDGAATLLVSGGRMTIITFHSLEDRTVKLWGRKQSKIVLPVAAQEEERKLASYERSARLRVFKKI